MALGDPLAITRLILLSDPAVEGLVADQIYATPILPPDHSYPLIRLSHIGSSGYAPVGFRQSAVAAVQLDVFGYDQTVVAEIAEAALDVLHGTPIVSGAISIKPTFEAREIDETVQPPLHRYRADLAVTVVRTTQAVPL